MEITILLVHLEVVDLEVEVVEEDLVEILEDQVEILVEAQDLHEEVHLVHPNPLLLCQMEMDPMVQMIQIKEAIKDPDLSGQEPTLHIFHPDSSMLLQ